MPDDDFSDDTDHDADGNSNVKQMRDRIKALEAEAKTGREAAQKAAGLERELAFSKAGIDASSPMAKYFVNGYGEGDTSPEAIRAAAAEAGVPLLGAASSTPAPDRSADVATHTAMNQASGGVTTEGDKNAAYHAALAATDGSWDQVKPVLEQFKVPTIEDNQ